jgi:HK97 family phage prohead protease
VPDTIRDERALAASLLGQPDLQLRELGQLQLRVQTDQDGSFDGYACPFDVRDSYGTTFAPHSFTAGGLDQDAYPLLFMHQPDRPVGVFYAKEDGHGLHVVGRWDDTQAGQDARVQARSGSAPGLSVGFVPVGMDPQDDARFVACRLVEVSQITRRMQAVPGATLVGVRSAADVDRLRAIARAKLTLARLR